MSDGKSQTLVIPTSVGLQHFIYCPQYEVLIDMNRRLLKRNITVGSISTHSVLGMLSKKLFDQKSSNAPCSCLPKSEYMEAARQVPVDSQHAGMQPVNISLTLKKFWIKGLARLQFLAIRRIARDIISPYSGMQQNIPSSYRRHSYHRYMSIPMPLRAP